MSQIPEQSRLKRTPLPPQSARFREASRRVVAPMPSPAVQPLLAPKDGGMVPRATNADSNLPSGPRNQPQIAPSRDTSHSDLRNNPRLPPSGPSAGSTARFRRNDPPLNANQQPPVSRDRSAMEIDSVPPVRSPPLRVNDMPIRANSGMYADRELQRVEISTSTDTAPKGPRAMTNRMSVTSSASFAQSPSLSPSTPIYTQRHSGGQDRGTNRALQRSPPPHVAINNGFQSRDGSAAMLSAGISRQNMPARRPSNASERSQQKQGLYQEVESRDQSRRDLPGFHARHDQASQAPPPAPRGFSGSNSIPIGSRKGQNNGQAPMPPQSGANRRSGVSLSSGNVVPISPMVDDYQTQSLRMNPQLQDTYDDDPMTPPHLHRPVSPEESFQTSAASGRSRGPDNWFSGASVSRPGAPVRDASPPRTWTPRHPQQHHAEYAHHETDFRDETPPLSAREPSWDVTDRRLPPNTFSVEGPHYTNQFDGDIRHDAREQRYRRSQHIEVDRVSTHPAPLRGTMSIDTRVPQQSDERYVEDPYRSQPAESPSSLRRQASFPGHSQHNVGYAGDRDSFAERQPSSWDRDQELQRDQYSPAVGRSIHPDRARMFEVSSQSGPAHDPSAPHSSKPIRNRPGSHPVREHPGDFPVHPEVPGEHWISDGGRRAERTREESARSHSHQQRPTPSRRGGSLLDRLSLDNATGSSGMSSPSLRDRVQIIPSKRDREEMVGGDAAGGFDMDEGGPDDSVSKKPKRRVKRGRRGAQ